MLKQKIYRKLLLSDQNEKLQNEMMDFMFYDIDDKFEKQLLALKEKKLEHFKIFQKKQIWKLHDHLVNQKMDFSIIYMKCGFIMFAQDFPIDDSLRIWDWLLCQKKGGIFILQMRHYVCTWSFLLNIVKGRMNSQRFWINYIDFAKLGEERYQFK